MMTRIFHLNDLQTIFLQQQIMYSGFTLMVQAFIQSFSLAHVLVHEMVNAASNSLRMGPHRDM